MAQKADLASGWNVGARGQVPWRECPWWGVFAVTQEGDADGWVSELAGYEHGWEKNWKGPISGLAKGSWDRGV